MTLSTSSSCALSPPSLYLLLFIFKFPLTIPYLSSLHLYFRDTPDSFSFPLHLPNNFHIHTLTLLHMLLFTSNAPFSLDPEHHHQFIFSSGLRICSSACCLLGTTSLPPPLTYPPGRWSSSLSEHEEKLMER